MKVLFLIPILSVLSWGQSCSHTTSRTPTGPLMVFRNGNLLVDTTDYIMGTTLGATTRTITPRVFSDQDHMAVAMTTVLAQTLAIPGGVSVQYNSFQLWREDWICSGSKGTPPTVVSPFPGCASDGAGGLGCDGAITSGKSIQAGKGQQISGGVDFGGASGGRVGIAGADNAGSPFVVYLMPIGDGTGKFLHDAGVVPCPAFDASVISKSPICHQWEWVSIP